MKILSLGWFGHENIGDDSYLLSLPKLFPQHEFKHTDTLKTELIDWCDAVLLGGGNVLKESYLKQLKSVKSKPVYALSVGCETDSVIDVPFKHVYVREPQSLKRIKGDFPKSIIPDLAFALDPDPVRGRYLIQENFRNERADLYEKTVVVVVNAYLMKNSLDALARDAFTFINFSYHLTRIIDETCASFIFLPFGTKIPADDRVSNSWVASKCKYWKKNHVIFDRLSVQDTLDIISACDSVISTRLHSSIFSFISGVPFIDISHHSKNESFLEYIGKQDASLSYWHFDSQKMANLLKTNIHLPKHKEFEPFKLMLKEKINAVCFNQ